MEHLLASEYLIPGSLVLFLLGIFLAFPLGLVAIPLTIMIWLALGALILLFVPDSKLWTTYVDRKVKAQYRKDLRGEIFSHSVSTHNPFSSSNASYNISRNLQSYDEMYEKVEQMHQSSLISDGEYEKLQDATLDFLKMLHTQCLLDTRMRSPSKVSERDLKSLEENMIFATKEDLVKLREALSRLTKAKKQRERDPVLAALLQAQITHIADSFDDVFLKTSTSTDMGTQVSNFIQETAEKLALEEEINSNVEREFRSMPKQRALQ